MNIKETLRILKNDDWEIISQRGNHRNLKHSFEKERMTVHGKPSADLAPGTLNSILKQAGLK